MNIFQTSAVVICAAAASIAVPVSAQQWQGTWTTRFGEFRLFQSGDHVFGDYGDGTIEGIIDPRTGRLRARFRNPNGSTGYAELLIQPDNVMFAGAFKWEAEPLPTYEDSAPDRRWVGRRTASTAPTNARVSRNANRANFIASAPAKYREWIGAGTTTAATNATAAPQATNSLADRFPVLKDYPANFRPRFFEVTLDSVAFYGPRGEGSPRRPAELYGTMGLFAYCETATGTRALIPFGNAPNRVFDTTRDRPFSVTVVGTLDRNKTTRRFAFDENCLRDRDARISVQLQSNLKEKNLIKMRDANFGYNSLKYYLDQVPIKSQRDQSYVVGARPITASIHKLNSDQNHTVVYNLSNQGEFVDIFSTLSFAN